MGITRLSLLSGFREEYTRRGDDGSYLDHFQAISEPSISVVYTVAVLASKSQISVCCPFCPVQAVMGSHESYRISSRL